MYWLYSSKIQFGQIMVYHVTIVNATASQLTEKPPGESICLRMSSTVFFVRLLSCTKTT